MEKVKVHQTRVKYDVQKLKEVEDALRNDWANKGGTTTGPERREFLSWSKVYKFLNGLAPTNGEAVLSVEGSYSGQSTRVYYKPSVTSMPKPTRKAIVPLTKGNRFVFMDLKSAEFVLACLYAGMNDIVDAYRNGLDPYDFYAKKLGISSYPRDVYKRIFIGYVYGITPYTVAKQLGTSETFAERLLSVMERQAVQLTRLKMMIKDFDKKPVSSMPAYSQGVYKFPLQLVEKPSEFSYFLPDKPWSDNLAWSAYIQSALGWQVQQAIRKLEKEGLAIGTVLTVFDSFLMEVNDETQQKVVDLLTEHFKPLYGKFTIGNTFWEAAYEGRSI